MTITDYSDLVADRVPPSQSVPDVGVAVALKEFPEKVPEVVPAQSELSCVQSKSNVPPVSVPENETAPSEKPPKVPVIEFPPISIVKVKSLFFSP